MCVECGTVLSVSNSPVALQERAFIREQIAAGKDKAQIKAALVDEYGEEILAKPEADGFNAALWMVPIALVLLAAGGIGVAVARWRRNAGAETIEAELPPELSAEDATAPGRGVAAVEQRSATRRSSRPSRSASSASSRRACCRSSRATCGGARASRSPT